MEVIVSGVVSKHTGERATVSKRRHPQVCLQLGQKILFGKADFRVSVYV